MSVAIELCSWWKGAIGRDMTPQPVIKPNAGAELPEMFTRYKSWVEQELSRSVPRLDEAELYPLLRYHLGWVDQYGNPAGFLVSQGKALRPTLCLFACEALSQDVSRAAPAAAALELIHNFSLIHDDIQDGDQERRHQPTVWQLWGVPKALVAGNALQCVGDLALLNTVQSQASADSDLPGTVLKVSQLLTDSYLQRIEGQCMDLAFETQTTITTEEYLEMIACKTGALIRSGLEIGALLATDDPSVLNAFCRFGSSLGRVFQIRDDYLGIWGDQAKTGKPAGNDIRRRKKSFPVVFAFGQASGRAREDLQSIYAQTELDEDDVNRVLAVMDEVGAQDECQRLTQVSAEEALCALEGVSLPQWARDETESLVSFLALRDY